MEANDVDKTAIPRRETEYLVVPDAPPGFEVAGARRIRVRDLFPALSSALGGA